MATLHDIEVDDYLKECVYIEPLQMEAEFTRLPGDFAYWGERYSRASRAFLLAEREEKTVRAKQWLVLRAKMVGEGQKATEAAVDATVEADPAVQAAYLARLEAEAEKDRLRTVLESIRTKREMLVSLGATIRQEMENDPVIRSRLAARRTDANF
jgi:hypothetical protein